MIDGFGIAPPSAANAITLARTPNWNRLMARWPSTELSAFGLDVGLPAGVMGNSEVGHLNIGAGRVIQQDIVRIDEAVSTGSIFDNATLLAAALAAARSPGGPHAVNRAINGAGRLHLMGLCSDGYVHASDVHVRALVDLAARHLPPDRILVHVFTDGRDTPPRSAERYVGELVDHCRGKATIATVSGRYFAMDRDKRWERTERVWRAVVCGDSEVTAPDAMSAVTRAYERGETDEFIQPTVIVGGSVSSSRSGGSAAAGETTPHRELARPLVRRGDAAIFWNFRADRARQLCSALVDPGFLGFPRQGHFVPELRLVSMTEYDEKQTWPAAFPPIAHRDLLADVWSRAGMRQLRIAETEKYAHVTYFFNGGREEPVLGEERILIASPKVATYDLQPEMSARELTERLLWEIRAAHFDAFVLNFANPDMLGHTGLVGATIRAVEVVDDCLGRLADEVVGRGGIVAVTADHGNAEQMIDPVTGQPHTAHTTNPVPFLVCGAPAGVALSPGGRLSDVAPTLLEITGLGRPPAMTGKSLVRSA